MTEPADIDLNLRLVFKPDDVVDMGVMARGLKPYADIEIDPSDEGAVEITVTAGGGIPADPAELRELFLGLAEALEGKTADDINFGEEA